MGLKDSHNSPAENKMKTLLIFLILALPLGAREPLAQRIAHTDPSQFNVAKGVHGGSGELHYKGMFESSAFGTNFLFLHRGVIPPNGGIGHHYHNQMEEMFVIFDNEAQFTIDGRTSVLKGPAGAPCRMGRSHAIYNFTSQPTEWMNIAVSSVKGKYDAFDLGDGRVGVPLDAKPVFITMHLDRKLLRAVQGMNGGSEAVHYRRTLTHDVFYTNWAYVDHAVLPPGSSIGRHRHEGVEEFYYVMSGEGTARVGGETAPIRKGDAVPILLTDVHSFENTGSQDLEFMVVAVSRVKGLIDSTDMK